MQVIIIGAGLGGLALAQCLVRAGIEVVVCERDAALETRFQGYRIGLLDRGVADLRHVVPPQLHPLLAAISGEVSGTGRAVDEQLVELGVTPARDEGLLFDRDVLRRLLLAGLGERVRFGHKLDSYDELPDGRVRVSFQDREPLTCDVLVGADGMGSTVRRQLLPHVQIRDLGVHGAIGRTVMSERFARLVPGWSTMVVSGELRLFLGKMPFSMPPPQAAAKFAPEIELPATPSYIRWVMLLPDLAAQGDILPATGSAPADTLAAIRGIVSTWHPELRALIAEADRDNSGVGPLRIGPAIDPWPTRAVTLLGDAAHPMPPGGMGANLAFRDARELSSALLAADSGKLSLRSALTAYERELCAYGRKMRDEALAQMPFAVPAQP